MLRRPASRSSSLAKASSSSFLLSSSTSVARRLLSTSPPLLLRGRVKPEREMFPKRDRVHPLTVRQIEDKQITEQLTEEAGGKWKDKLTYGITRQTEYFTREAMRMDREKATEAILKDLPPLTENDIDDFYVNLMASGNELSNLPSLASPNRTAASMEEQRKFILQHESKEEEIKRLQKEGNVRLIQESVKARQQLLLEAHSVQPQQRFNDSRGRIGSGEVLEQEMETIGVQQQSSREDQTRRLEINEKGEVVDQEEDSGRFSSSFSSSPFEDSVRPPPHQLSETAPPTSSQSQASKPSPSPRTTSEPSSTQSFEERYPHATRLSTSSLPPSSTTTTAEESTSTDSKPPTPSSSSETDAGRSLVASRPTPTTTPSSPPQHVSSSSSSSSIATTSNPINTFLSLPPSSDLIAHRPSTLTQIDLPPHRLPAAASFIPPPTPLLLSLEQAILAAEASRVISSADHYASPDYLTLPPLDPILHGPPSPIQPHASFLKGPVKAKANATTFPGEPHSAYSPGELLTFKPKSGEGDNPDEVRYPTPLPTDVKKRLTKEEGAFVKPMVLPLGLMTNGEWKSVVYKTLVEPDRLQLERKEKEKAYGWGRSLEYREKEEKKNEIKRKEREEANKRLGRLPRRNKEEQARSLEKAGYALLAAKGLELMVRSGAKPEKEWFLDILKVLSESGDVNGVQMVITQSEEAGYPANYATYTHLVLAHLGNNDLHGAVAALHNLESRSLYPLETTYRALIQPLVHSEIDAHRATGWDLFAHMRLVAHPIPSKETYDMIIGSCSNVMLPEPERALDLWTEMTIDNKIPPDVHSFNSIIRAVGASRKFYLESFKLMRQMLDFYHTSVPDSAQRAMYTPNRATFEALLVGAKKNGDIARTRWILTEMIRFSNHPGMRDDGADISPRAATMVDIFQAYSAAKANIKKGDLNFAKQVEAKKETLRVEEGQRSVEGGSNEAVEVMEEEEDSNVEEVTVEVGGAWEDGGEEDFTGEEDWTVIDSETLQDALDLGRVPSEAESAEEAAWDSFDASDYTPPPPLPPSHEPSPSSSTSASTNFTDIPGPEFTPPQQQPQGNVQNSPIPQSQNEILHEARRLLSHASDDSAIFLANPKQRTPSGNLPSLRHVLINTQVLNAFLQVQYEHSDNFAEKVAAFETIFEEYGVRRDARSYADVISMMRYTVGKMEREKAAEECFRIWQDWERFEKEGNEYLERIKEQKGKDVEFVMRKRMGLEPRMVEKIWVTAISIMALSGQLSIGLSMLKRFAALYPPALIIKAILPPLPSQALIRLFARSSHRPDPLPPHILFPDIRDLHSAFSLLQQATPLAYIKWITSSYAEAIHHHRHRKLSDPNTLEGRTRSKEKKLNRELKKTSWEVYEKKHPDADDRDLPGRSGRKSFSDMERGGGFGRKPKDLKMGVTEAKIFRVWGQDVLDRYLRAKRQF